MAAIFTTVANPPPHVVTYNQDLPQPSPENPTPDLNPGKPLPLIIRATNGKGKKERSEKLKLSTVVQPEDLEGFFARYQDVCKAGMGRLKPRDRSKKKVKAKKKKGGTGGGAAGS